MEAKDIINLNRMNVITKVSEKIAESEAKHIEEFACAFLKKTDADPRKIVMITHRMTTKTGVKTVYWFEKKRGRSRKGILDNLKP